jgi:hypothetical protein
MSNHYHLVLYVDRDIAKSWNTNEVIKRWQRLFKGSDRARLAQPPESSEYTSIGEHIASERANQQGIGEGSVNVQVSHLMPFLPEISR